MRLRPAFLTCALLLAPAAGRAEVFVIPLPDVLGTYSVTSVIPGPGTTERTATFRLPGTPAFIHGASLHVLGTAEVGTLTCDAPAAITYPWTTELIGFMSDPPNNDWYATSPMPAIAGPFEWTASFQSFGVVGNPATWAFLADGVGEIRIRGMPQATVLCSTSSPPPSLTLTGAWLLVEADIPVPAHGASWGSVKAIYR